MREEDHETAGSKEEEGGGIERRDQSIGTSDHIHSDIHVECSHGARHVLKLFLMVLAARILGVFLEWTWIWRLVVVVVIGGPPLRDIADRACRMVDPELLSMSYGLLFNGFSFWVVYSLNW